MQHRRMVLACALSACALLAAAPSGAVAKTKQKSNTAQTDQAINELKGQLAALGQQVGELKGKTDGFGVIAAAAPQIVDGLTQLKTGLETLAGAYQAVEYGVAQVNVRGGGTIVNPPAWSGDIPDDGNGASTAGTALWPNLGGAVTKTFTVNAYVRSNEADCCSGQGGPVAQGGALMSAIAIDPVTGSAKFLTCNGDPTTGGIGGITPMGEPINTPDGAKKDQPLTNIMTGKPRTDQTLPGGDAPQLATCTVNVPAAPVPGVAPTVVQISWQASFLDIPTTTSPGPRD